MSSALAAWLQLALLVAALAACRVNLQKLPWGDLRFYIAACISPPWAP